MLSETPLSSPCQQFFAEFSVSTRNRIPELFLPAIPIRHGGPLPPISSGPPRAAVARMSPSLAGLPLPTVPWPDRARGLVPAKSCGAFQKDSERFLLYDLRTVFTWSSRSVGNGAVRATLYSNCTCGTSRH